MGFKSGVIDFISGETFVARRRVIDEADQQTEKSIFAPHGEILRIENVRHEERKHSVCRQSTALFDHLRKISRICSAPLRCANEQFEFLGRTARPIFFARVL